MLAWMRLLSIRLSLQREDFGLVAGSWSALGAASISVSRKTHSFVAMLHVVVPMLRKRWSSCANVIRASLCPSSSPATRQELLDPKSTCNSHPCCRIAILECNCLDDLLEFLRLIAGFNNLGIRGGRDAEITLHVPHALKVTRATAV